ncbi:hypothetical protein [Variovorax sp. CY25R-8]|uniref:hypothetical protein n=1 Tax=Variovorax sp. CY25R-8 TaxID=2855501 RepID=UPI0021BB3BB2|nr:hypothetical protein [Variovorax sp. CY25R-8]MCT8178877.1 hypothetical protein [Variovorax sp. CY25R-8]
MGLARLKDPRGWGASVADGARDPEWRLAERPGERDLFVRGLGGDASAYREFLRGTAHALRGFIGRHAGSDPDEVEALVQECLLAIHARRHTWQDGQPVAPWVEAIARYKIRTGRPAAAEAGPDRP